MINDLHALSQPLADHVPPRYDLEFGAILKCLFGREEIRS